MKWRVCVDLKWYLQIPIKKREKILISKADSMGMKDDPFRNVGHVVVNYVFPFDDKYQCFEIWPSKHSDL